MSETRVCYAPYLGVPNDEGWGTSDIIAIKGNELQVDDYKHGQGVEVFAEENPQMKLYALGALPIAQDLADIDTVRLVIHQPRIKSEPSEWVVSVAELENWGRTTARSSVITRQNAQRLYGEIPDEQWEETFLNPNDKSCKFCKAKATCPAKRAQASTAVVGYPAASPDEFTAVKVPGKAHIEAADAAWLGAVLAKADQIDDWLSAVRAEAHRRLTAGEKVPGFKLVQGKRGNRYWSNSAEAEALMKDTFRLKVEEMYELKLISPTKAEELAPNYGKDGKVIPPKEGQLAPLIGPRQWPKLKALIAQADGKPSVAPESDKRPAISVTPVASEFEAVTDDVCDFA
jgi:hypothetical protein